jgi:hypothetical protein
LVKEFFDHNRFQLERMVFTLADVFPRLTFTSASTLDILLFDSATSLWQVLNGIQYEKANIIGIRHHSEIYYTPVIQLLNFMPETV